MEPALQRRIQRYGWDRAADHYERFWAAQLRPAQDCLVARAALQPGERVLDLACGTGLVSCRAAAAVGPTGQLLGTDLSQRMVERAGIEASTRGLVHARFARMDAEHLDVPDASFDAALCSLGLMYVPMPVQALREMHRSLVAGGRAVAAVWGERRRCGWAEIFPIVDARVQSEVCPLFFRLGTGDALAHDFSEAGFVDVETDRLATTLWYGSDEEALGAAFAGGPVAMAYSRFDDATREAAHAEYLDSIASYREGGGYGIPGEFVIVRGRKA